MMAIKLVPLEYLRAACFCRRQLMALLAQKHDVNKLIVQERREISASLAYMRGDNSNSNNFTFPQSTSNPIITVIYTPTITTIQNRNRYQN